MVLQQSPRFHWKLGWLVTTRNPKIPTGQSMAKYGKGWKLPLRYLEISWDVLRYLEISWDILVSGQGGQGLLHVVGVAGFSQGIFFRKWISILIHFLRNEHSWKLLRSLQQVGSSQMPLGLFHSFLRILTQHQWDFCAKDVPKEGWVQIVLFLGHYEGYFWRQDPKRAPGDYEGYGFLGTSAEFRRFRHYDILSHIQTRFALNMDKWSWMISLILHVKAWIGPRLQ